MTLAAVRLFTSTGNAAVATIAFTRRLPLSSETATTISAETTVTPIALSIEKYSPNYD